VGHRPDHIFDGGGASHFLALSLLIDVRLAILEIAGKPYILSDSVAYDELNLILDFTGLTKDGTSNSW
jgi:hypothetical protein